MVLNDDSIENKAVNILWDWIAEIFPEHG